MRGSLDYLSRVASGQGRKGGGKGKRKKIGAVVDKANVATYIPRRQAQGGPRGRKGETMASSKESWFVKLAKEGCSKQHGSEKPPAVFDADAAMKAATLEPKPSAADEARKRFRPRPVAEPTIQRGRANRTRPLYSTLGCADVTHGAQKFRPLPGKRQPARTVAVLGRCDTVVRFR